MYSFLRLSDIAHSLSLRLQYVYGAGQFRKRCGKSVKRLRCEEYGYIRNMAFAIGVRRIKQPYMRHVGRDEDYLAFEERFFLIAYDSASAPAYHRRQLPLRMIVETYLAVGGDSYLVICECTSNHIANIVKVF